MKIYKYDLDPVRPNTIMLPEQSRLLCVREDTKAKTGVVLYALHGTGEDRPYQVLLLPTGDLAHMSEPLPGDSLPELGPYLGTVKLNDWYVAHAFMVITK